MVWTETGPYADGDDWKTKAMQSANPGDTGLTELTSKPQLTNLILPPDLRSALSSPNSNSYNDIVTGIAYLLFASATFGQKTITDKKDTKSVTVAKGDTLDGLARKLGTTVKVLEDANFGVSPKTLKPGMVLKYTPAKTVPVITSWRVITADSAAAMYNGHGDAGYADKVNFFYAMIKSNPALR
jgi:LysM repeat protein